MAQIGCLGDVAFTVSSDLVQTPNNIQWSGSARYSTHQVHGGNALTEFCGIDPDAMSLDIMLSSDLGTNPMTELVKLWTYNRTGTAVPLVLGEKIYGKYRWNIKSLKIKMERTDARGNLTWATVSLSLVEYVK